METHLLDSNIATPPPQERMTEERLHDLQAALLLDAMKPGMRDELIGEIYRARAREALLEAGLRPFARATSGVPRWEDSFPLCIVSGHVNFGWHAQLGNGFTVGELFAAATLLAPTPAAPNCPETPDSSIAQGEASGAEGWTRKVPEDGATCWGWLEGTTEACRFKLINGGMKFPGDHNIYPFPSGDLWFHRDTQPAPPHADAREQAIFDVGPQSCHSDQDDFCDWNDCPQLRDGEPKKSGRSCPLWAPVGRGDDND